MAGFQKNVRRQYTLGFVGEIVRDGTLRAMPGRIASDTTQSDGSTNRIGRVFGYVAESGAPDDETVASTITVNGVTFPVGRAAEVATVEVGGTIFFGILGIPKHYALQGTATDGALSASYDLPFGTEGEFIDMTAGMVVEILNASITDAQTVTFGDKLAYVPKGISSTDNPNGLPLGAIVAYSDTLPTGFLQVPNAFVKTSLTLPASATGNLSGTPVVIQLTN